MIDYTRAWWQSAEKTPYTTARVDWTTEKQGEELLKTGGHGGDSQDSEDSEKEVLCDLPSLESGAESHSLLTPL